MKRILSSSFVAMSFLAAVAVAQSASPADPRIIAGTVNVFVFPATPPGTPHDAESDEEDGRFQRTPLPRFDDGGSPPLIRVRLPAAGDERDGTDGHRAELIGAIANDRPAHTAKAVAVRPVARRAVKAKGKGTTAQATTALR